MIRKYLFTLFIFLLLTSEFLSAYDRGDKLLWACNADENAGISEALEKSHCIGYITGIVDGVQLIFGATPESRLFCPPNTGMSSDQQVRIVTKWLENHPEDLHKGGRILVLLAFIEAFPCE